MKTSTDMKPDATEYAPYYDTYVSLVPEGDILQTLSRQLDATLALLAKISEEQGTLRYAPGKWSVKEVIGHVVDSERIFGYRALRFARGDRTALASFEQDGYVANASHDSYTMPELAAEYEHVRQAHVSFFGHLGEEAWGRSGVASDNEVSVRALAYIIAGHELHHVHILRSRYLVESSL